MIQISLNIPRYRLNLAVKVIKRRKSRRVPVILKYLQTLGNVRVGSKASRVVRHALERVNLKAILGGNIAFMVITTSLVAPTSNVMANIEPEKNTVEVGQTPVVTEINIRYPLNGDLIVNQGFHYLHWGIDLKGPVGESVYPIMKGVVEITEYSRFGYGNSIVVDHQNGLKSRYAHLSRIDVRGGDEVNPKSSIGLVGSTGRSTGPHLHLEIYQNGRVVNPKTVIPLN